MVQYLGRYTHRIAISNRRIERIDTATGQVSFRCKDYRRQGAISLVSLDAVEFIRRFLQHCLPPGFQKIRYYGILATRNRKDKLAVLQHSLGYTPPKVEAAVQAPNNDINHPLCCPACGKPTLARTFIPASLMFAHSLPFSYQTTQRAPPPMPASPTSIYSTP